MKNTIYKSYAKKILKSEAFVSVIIVFVLALGIIGTSYALYMDIDTDTNYQLVEVGDLSIGFNNGDSTISLENMTPTSDDIATGKQDSDIAREISTKNLTSFYIYNTGTYTANYDIKLKPLNENEVDVNSIKYQICRDNSQNCKDINILGNQENYVIYKDELTPNSTAIDTNNSSPSAYYYLRIWIDENYEGENKAIKLQIVIDAKNASGYLDNDKTLAGTILNNPKITINNNVPDFSSIADYIVTGDVTSGELGLYKIQDDEGVSYYFRGAQSYNYVNFANMCWRVVRIEGDGSVKLILEDWNYECNSELFTGNWSDGNTYKYGHDLNYKPDFLNYDGGLADSFKTFQTTKLANYLDKLKVDEWCYDNEITKIIDGVENYGAYTRIIANNTPSLKCTGTKITKYKDNTDMYVGTLSADEVAISGALDTSNENLYLVNNYKNAWCTLSPYISYTNNTGSSSFRMGDNFINEHITDACYSRPVIVLKSNTLATTDKNIEEIGQPGSKTNPYTIKN